MQILQKICFGNYILSVALLSWLCAQICKTIINYFMSGKFDAERLYGAGGMPSSHSALVCALFIATAKKTGISSTEFAFAFVLAAIVMYDAMGVRRSAGEHAKLLNKLLDEWMPDDDTPIEMKKLKEKLGHTPSEVLSGALLGILIAILIPIM